MIVILGGVPHLLFVGRVCPCFFFMIVNLYGADVPLLNEFDGRFGLD